MRQVPKHGSHLFPPDPVQRPWRPRGAAGALPLGRGPVAASLRGGKQRRRRGGQVGKPLRAQPRRPQGGWRDGSQGGKRETKARRLADAGSASSPVQDSRGRRAPSHPPPLPGTWHQRDRPTPLTSGEALRLPPTAPEKASPLAHAHSRTRALALSPLRPPRAPLRQGSGPPRPCPSAPARTNRVAWTAQRWSRGLTSQSPNCPRQAPGSDVPRGSVAT